MPWAERKRLCLPGRLEAFHLPFSSSRRPVRVSQYYVSAATTLKWQRRRCFSTTQKMGRPNIVAGLIEKRRELVACLKLTWDETKTLPCGIDAIDVVLKLFAPEIDG